MENSASSTRQKALALNLDATNYGAFAEIGGGQEVARWFFAVGGAAGTVAKTISAYDMAVSDGLYGPAKRYVSRQRLEAMLEQELAHVLDRRDGERVDNRLMSLQLVERGFTDAAMFTAEGEVVQPSEVLYKKPILVERGSFRPATKLTLDLLERALEQFLQEPAVRGQKPVVLAEMTL